MRLVVLILGAYCWSTSAIPLESRSEGVITKAGSNDVFCPGNHNSSTSFLDLPSVGSDIERLDYTVPGTTTSLRLNLYLKLHVWPAVAVYFLQYLLRDVAGILRTHGDGLVPGQKYTDDDQYMKGHWIHLRISSAVTQTLLTWQIVQDTLNGMLDQYLVKRRTCKADAAIISKARLVGFAFIYIDQHAGQVSAEDKLLTS
ncbi:hypothetical protein Q9189_007823 [Teloschistes chrysophthalmus]